MSARPWLLAGACAVLATGAAAQANIGANVETGLHWSVSAPEGASWSLVCRFPPVTYRRNNYDRDSWINRLVDQGRGPSRGRLPLDRGSCKVTKTGGEGPVAIAVGRPGEVSTDAVRATGQTAAAGLL